MVIDIGSVVTLKQVHGPRMLVNGIDLGGTFVQTLWFNQYDQLQTARIATLLLEEFDADST